MINPDNIIKSFWFDTLGPYLLKNFPITKVGIFTTNADVHILIQQIEAIIKKKKEKEKEKESDINNKYHKSDTISSISTCDSFVSFKNNNISLTEKNNLKNNIDIIIENEEEFDKNEINNDKINNNKINNDKTNNNEINKNEINNNEINNNEINNNEINDNEINSDNNQIFENQNDNAYLIIKNFKKNLNDKNQTISEAFQQFIVENNRIKAITRSDFINVLKNNNILISDSEENSLYDKFKIKEQFNIDDEDYIDIEKLKKEIDKILLI